MFQRGAAEWGGPAQLHSNLGWAGVRAALQEGPAHLNIQLGWAGVRPARGWGCTRAVLGYRTDAEPQSPGLPWVNTEPCPAAIPCSLTTAEMLFKQ